MLKRVEHESGIVTLQSRRLSAIGVVHGFSTRHGGISPPPYDTLNLGRLTKGEGDANTSVAENFRRLRRALGLERHMRFEVQQVHGGEVFVAGNQPIRPSAAPSADAVVVERVPGPQRLATVRVADCVPLLLARADGKRVAAVHAGWRGVVAGVVPQAVAAVGGDLLAAIGPCIGVAHFEVGEEVAAAFADAGLGHAIDRSRGPRPHIDLRAAVRRQLVSAGVRERDIDQADACTYRDAADYFSHRRDVTHRGLPATGRMAAVIAPARPG